MSASLEAVRACQTATEVAAFYGRLDGRNILITGASNGLGFETAKALLSAGATVILACRAGDKATAAKLELDRMATPNASVHLLSLNLADPQSVRACVASYAALKPSLPNQGRLSALICNAGVNGVPTFGALSPGIESQLATNLLGHALLHDLLQSSLKECPDSRLVVLSSESHRRIEEPIDISIELPPRPENYDSLRAYAFSNLARLLWARALSKRVSYPVLVMHPGVVANTGMMQHMGVLDKLRQIWLALCWELRPSNLTQSAAAGARTQTWAAVAPIDLLLPLSGVYLSGNANHGGLGAPVQPSPLAQRDDMASEVEKFVDRYVEEHRV
jgi:NAD(P)-dependent dehydrogenase (short-subunit alcohol dehydrogenase family)